MCPLIAIALVIAVFAFPGVVAAQNTPTPTIYNHSTASTTLNYWNAARLAAAVPVDMRLAGGESVQPAEAPASSGAPGAAGGIRPVLKAAQNPEPPADSTLAGSAEEIPIPADGSYPGPNTTYEYTQNYQT
jgi:hypothetical protein